MKNASFLKAILNALYYIIMLLVLGYITWTCLSEKKLDKTEVVKKEQGRKINKNKDLNRLFQI